MADWAAALIARLHGDATLEGLVGGRIDWDVLPQEQDRPALVLTTISDPIEDHYRGEQDFRQTRVQVDAYSDVSSAEAAAIAEAVKAAVRPAPGTNGADQSGAWSQDGVRFDRPGAEGPVDSGEQLDTLYVFRARVDLLLWHSEEEG